MPGEGPTDGVIVCHGGHTGGYALYLKGRRLHYVHNVLGTQEFKVAADVELPCGPVLARFTFTPTDRFAGDVELWYGDVIEASEAAPHFSVNRGDAVRYDKLAEVLASLAPGGTP